MEEVKDIISEELLSQLGYGKVTYIGDITEVYDMQCLMFRCDIINDSGRGEGKSITTSKTYYIALEVIANKCKVWARKNDNILVEHPLVVRIRDTRVRDKNNLATYVHYIDDDEIKFFMPERVYKATQWVYDKIKKEEKC